MSPEAVRTLASWLLTLAQPIADAIIAALRDDDRESVLEEMRAARERLPAPGSVSAAVEAVVARHASVALAHAQARAELARDVYGITDTARTALARVRAGAPLDEAGREDVRAVVRLLDAAIAGEVVVARSPLSPPALDEALPRALFGEPDHHED